MGYDFSLVHKFRLKDSCIVLDINSGLVHCVSEEAYDFLDYWEKAGGNEEKAKQQLQNKYEKTVLEQIYNEYKLLIEKDMLFTKSEIPESFEINRESIVKALCLHVAHDCNMRCRYCFGGTGNFGGKREMMELETGKQALEFLFKVSGKRKHIEVDYFGGEPLLNFKVVKELILYGEKRAEEEGKDLKQTLTTNGILLDKEKIDFLNRHDIFMILSLDGRPEVHNKMRPLAHNKASYPLVYKGIKAYVDSDHPQTYFVRGTFTHHNLDFPQDIVHLVEQGFDRLSLEPVVAPYECDYAIKKEDIPTIKNSYDDLVEVMLNYRKKGKPISFFHFNISLDKGPCLAKRISGCGAGHEYLAVAPNGDLYPCHQFVGQEDFIVGTVKEGITDHKRGQEFKRANVLNKESCKDCWARYFCGGGCHANAYNYNGSILKPYEIGCELQKKRFECAIYLQVKAHKQEE